MVRHPLDRLVSVYAFTHKGEVARPEAFRQWVRDGMPCTPNLELPVSTRAPLRRRWITAPQMEWLEDADGALGVDYTLRFEELAAAWKWFAEPRGLVLGLPHHNISQRSDWRGYYDAETEEIARARYRRDFEALGYT